MPTVDPVYEHPDPNKYRVGEHGSEPRRDAASAESRANARDADDNRGGVRSTLAVLPGLGVALMPKVVCPLCWPLYAGALSAAGLSFLMEDRWLLPISAAFLVAALAALCWRARTRRGYGPAAAGLVAAAAILVGKFAFESDTAVYGGVAALVAASVWNGWPRRTKIGACPACVSP